MKNWKLSIKFGVSLELTVCLPLTVCFSIPFYVIASSRGMGGLGLLLSLLFLLIVNGLFTLIMIKKGEIVELSKHSAEKNGKFIVLKDRFIKMDSIVKVKMFRYVMFYIVTIEEEKYLKTRFYFNSEEEAKSFINEMGIKELLEKK